MLDELRISSLGVIDDATLEFGPGLNVVTGETGAGKTMVVSALGLLLGARAEPSAVRQGARQARVEGRLRVDDAALRARIDELGGLLDDGVLIASRTVSAEGRSRATVGGAAVPIGVLASMTAEGVVVHGQADQQRLLLPSRQRDCLDDFGQDKVATAKGAYGATYHRLREVRETLREIVSQARQRAQEADLLRTGIAEISAADPMVGEDVALLDEERRLAHADGLRQAAESARLTLSGDESSYQAADAIALVAQARRLLEDERENDPMLASLADDLAAASFALADVAADISSYAARIETDPARLGAVSERRAVLAGLTRKYGETLEDVLAWGADAATRLADLSDDDARIAELSAERDALEKQLTVRGATLSDLRRAAGVELGQLVTGEIANLAMVTSQFAVALQPLPEPAAHGCDEVTFMLATHAGALPIPVAKGASGGELSRVMLALEVCLAGSTPPATMVFDEIDAGVGGKAAVEIGRRLARLAETSQVIVVTHLPQVAAFADRHHVVVRSSDGTVTTSGISALDEAGRLRELSRMLAGLEDSDTALAHASELVDLAKAQRDSRLGSADQAVC